MFLRILDKTDDFLELDPPTGNLPLRVGYTVAMMVFSIFLLLPLLALLTTAILAAGDLASGLKAMARALKNRRQGPGGDPAVRREAGRREARRRREELREETARARGEELDRARSRAFREILGPSGISGPGRDGGGAAPPAGEA
jgi:hypothetical protein